MKNALIELIPPSVVEQLVALDPDRVDISDLVRQVGNAYARFLHPDRHLDAPPKVQAGFNEILMHITEVVADLQSPDGLALAIERLRSGDRAQQLQYRADEERRERLLGKLPDTVVSLAANTDQLAVMGVEVKTTFMLEANGARVVLSVLARNKTVLSVSIFDETSALPEYPEKLVYEQGNWQEVYLSSDYPDQVRTYTHVLEPRGSVAIVGFVPAKAMMLHYQDAPLVFKGQFAELGGSLETAFRPQWAHPSEAWFLPYLTAEHQPGSEVVVRNKQGLVATVGTILGSAPLA